MARLDPAHPPLWRTPSSLQFGVDPLVVVNDPAPWQQRLVRELELGMPDTAVVPFAVAAGASSPAAERFVAQLEPVLAHSAEPPHAVLQSAGEVPVAHVTAVANAMKAAGCDAEHAHRFDPPGAAGSDASPLVVIAHRLVPPAFVAGLMSDDRAHLPIVLSPHRVQIGPLVVPGETACLSCLAAHRRDDDPVWPVIAAQLVGRPPADIDDALLSESGIVAARLLSRGATGRSLTLFAGSLRRDEEQHRWHEECRCRSLSGNETAAGLVRLEPTRPKEYARPA